MLRALATLPARSSSASGCAQPIFQDARDDQKKRRTVVTGELVESIARTLRRTVVKRARAQAMAPGIERLTDAVVAAAHGTDFNDEPARFGSMLVALKSSGPRR